MAISRRKFLKTGAGAAAASTLLNSLGACAPQQKAAVPAFSPLNRWPGRCVHNFNRAATENEKANRDVIIAMVDDSIKLLTGEKDVGIAWRSVFPAALSAKSKIAIKVNILNPDFPPHPFVVLGIVEGLKRMSVENNSFAVSNIVIYDSNNRSSFEQAGFSGDLFPGVNMIHHGSTQKDFGDGAHGNTPYAETLHRCDYLINVPGLRGHADYSGKVTLGFKSHYGTYPPKYHNNKTQPFLCDINCTGPVYKKTVLTVFGAIYGLKEGHGPRGEADSYLSYTQKIDPKCTCQPPSTVLMSTDPVTAEYQAIKIMRMRENAPYTIDSMPAFLRASAGIDAGIGANYNIGVIDETKMDVRRIVNGALV